MDANAKKRLKKLIIRTASFLVAGVAYYLFVRITGLRIPCVIYEITGKYCPGCGITRMCMALAQFDIVSAMRNNLLVFILLVPMLLFALRRAVIYVKGEHKGYNRIEMVLIILTAVLIVAFWILRNISAFSFLAPV